jgi:DNA-binding transcriptional LysR family regulator
MKQLSLDALRIFVTIIQQGGFTRAGDVLGRSQPAISLQMKKLEEQLDKKLFFKQGQGYTPTAEGRWLYNQAQRMLALNDEAFTYMAGEGLSGRIRLGIPSEFASLLLPSLIGEFATQYPEVSLDVTSGLSRELLNDTNRDHFDLVLALVEDKSVADAKHWVTDQLVWVGDANHPPSSNHVALVLAAEGCVYRSRVINKLKQQTVPWRVAYTNSDLGGLTAAMQQGLGITALARRSVPDNLQILKHRHLPALGHIHIGLFQRPNAGLSTRQQVVVDTLTQFLSRRLMGS